MNISQTAATEKQLLDRIRSDKEAFLEIYDTYFQRIYNYAYYRTFNQSEAEEITSQTFLSALENIERFEYRDVPVLVWLYRIASNAVADYYRKQARDGRLHLEQREADTSTEPETVVINRSEKEQLLQHLKTLPPAQQQAVVLRYLQNLSYREIAIIMDKTEGSVKQLLHRGLTGLRERMVDRE